MRERVETGSPAGATEDQARGSDAFRGWSGGAIDALAMGSEGVIIPPYLT